MSRPDVRSPEPPDSLPVWLSWASLVIGAVILGTILS